MPFKLLAGFRAQVEIFGFVPRPVKAYSKLMAFILFHLFTLREFMPCTPISSQGKGTAIAFVCNGSIGRDLYQLALLPSPRGQIPLANALRDYLGRS